MRPAAAPLIMRGCARGEAIVWIYPYPAFWLFFMFPVSTLPPPPPKRKKRAPESSVTEAGWTISIDDKCIKVKFLGLEHTFIPTT